MRASSLILAVTAVLAGTGTAFACNFCKLDNRSAVYSYEAVQKARAEPEKYEFLVVKVIGRLDEEGGKALEDWLKLRSGVAPETVRVATLQKAAGFVLDKSSVPEETVLRDLHAAFPRLTFRILRFED